MNESFDGLLDRLRNDELGVAEGIALLAKLRDTLQYDGAKQGGGANDDSMQLPRFATPNWVPRTYREETLAANMAFDTILLICDAAGASDWRDWRDGLAAAYPSARIVRIDVAEAEQTSDTLKVIPVGARVAVLLLDDLHRDTPAADVDVPERYLARVLSGFALMRELLCRREIERCHLLHLLPMGHALPHAAAWQGLAKSAVLECPRFASAGIWLSDSDLGRATVALVVRELAEMEPERHRDIGWIDGQRCMRVLVAKAQDGGVPTSGLFARGETVLITGGAGGVGLAIASRLTARFDLRVVLCGRRSAAVLDVCQRDWLARHPNVRYACIDVNDASNVRELMAELGASARLAAIFHAAGSVDDAPLRHKPLSAIRAVLAPKVLGTQLLDRHSAGLGVRYFVCFSSIASLVGSAGQTDYASGNGFMDEYCRIKQAAMDAGAGQCRYISINWPYWREGGMRADPRRLERLTAQSGLTSLGASEGFASLLHLLAHPAPQVVVLPGNRALIDRAFLSPQRSGAAEITDAVPARARPHAADALESELRALIAQTLKMEAEAIACDTPFNEYGFDSILLTELAATIGRRYPDLTLAVDVFLDHPTLRELSAWMHARLPAAPEAAPAKAAGDDDASSSRPGDSVMPAHDVLLDGLRALASTILKLPEADIDADTSWSQFGFDSITLSEFATLIARAFPTASIATDLFLSCATLAELAAHLGALLPAQVPQASAPALASIVVHEGGASDSTPADDAPGATEEIAIIGLAGRFPAADDLAGFWRNLIEGRCAVTAIPADRWRWQDYVVDAPGEPGGTDCHHASFLTAIDRFDAAHFGISPREAELMDPQQRLLLECAWEAFENAAIAPDSVRGRKIGLFFGAEKNDYLSLIADADVAMDAYINTGNAHAMLTNRVSYFFGLTGPSITLNTACSSSMTAIWAAVAGLRSGDCEMALAGGVNILLSPGLFALNRKMGMLTADEHVKPFDRDASGHLFGEGLGLVLLKPLRQALRDGDPVHGVIRAADVAHGGGGRFLTSPHAPSHEALIRSVLDQAGASLDDIDYLEAQGSGDQVTDRMELDTYHALYGASTRRTPLPIGSIKGHIGHLGAASGVTALIKVLLCMSQNRLLPVLHHRQLNWPHDAPFACRLLTEHVEWPPKTIEGRRVPRVAALHNYGYGGVNGHLLVRECLPLPVAALRWPVLARLWIFSARTAAQLRQTVARFVAYLRDGGYRLYGQPEPGVESIAYTLQTGRQSLKHRLALLIDDAPTDTALHSALGRLDGWLEHGQGDERLLAGVAAPAGVSADDEAFDAPLRVAALWVNGARIDWARFYRPVRPTRIRLPTYPFAATRHWVTQPRDSVRPPAIMPASAFAATQSSSTALHPLLHRMSGSDRNLRFVSTFAGDEAFFRDHRVRRAMTLPGAAYCEMFIAAATMTMPECERQSIGYRLDNLVWTRPLALTDAPVAIAVIMERLDASARHPGVPGYDAFRLLAKDAHADEAPPYAQAIAYPEARATLASPPAVAIERLPVHVRGARIDGTEVYRRFRALGFDYGPSHECIETLFHDGDEVLALLRLPETSVPAVAGYLLDPGLLDSALQASIGFGLDALEQGGAAMPLLPFGLERLRCYRASDLSRQVRCVHLRRRADTAGNPVVKLDVDLLDGDGAVCARLEGYSARRVKPDVPARSAHARGETVQAASMSVAWREEQGARVYPFRFHPDDLYLRHHQIDGRYLMPAFAMIDLARSVSDTLPHDDGAVLRIGRATWRKPLFVGTTGRDAVMRIVPRDGGWTVALESDDEGGNAVVYGQCELMWMTDAPAIDGWADLAHDLADPSEAQDTARLLAGSVRVPDGIEVVEWARRDDTIRLTLNCGNRPGNATPDAGTTSFALGFVIVDICGGSDDSAGLVVPYGIEECLLYRAPMQQVRVEIRMLQTLGSARTRAYDIRVADLEGRAVMKLTRLVLVALDDATPRVAPAVSVVETCAASNRSAALQRWLQEQVGQLQKIDPDQIGLDDDFTQFGLDSFSFTELSNRVNRLFSIDTMPTLFFDHGTARALADCLLRTYPDLDLEACIGDAGPETSPDLALAEHAATSQRMDIAQRRDNVHTSHEHDNLGDDGVLPKGTAKAPEAFDASDDLFVRYYRMAFGAIDGFGREFVALPNGMTLDVLHNFDQDNPKPPLLLLSPMACLGTAWLHQVREFAADYSVFVCHYPGHAASSGAGALRNGAGGLDCVAELFWSALDCLGVDAPVHLVGWSMGGLVAQCMARVACARVASLTLVNSIEGPSDVGGGVAGAMRALVGEISTHVAPEVNRHFDGDHRAIKACYDVSTYDVYQRLVMQGGVLSWLAYPPFPVLVLAGERDRVVPIETARRLHARLGEAGFEVLNEAGHYLPMTHAGFFNKRLRQQLETTF
ncbi:alpha/beta fold hydrolase [Xanthomonas nasturtii]|uniref:alpha/beta fold hydrolase n=1 Tax=Xanthomonas TaxID=338 RepID=UPI002B2262E8|nr:MULTISPECIES: alpha/beta fold hydrolase [Xanthomonas]MEA9557483.1 alpha/beta fold hydrolase [Xanthomonas nasturtii]MEA9588539.1 alpha/beta fold hydrolase [Xanthomonas sp. WHRI 10064B]MEA9613524.1 alpha/beta fold hydrolase [Xanthomonas sp. WHRI 10064A]